MTKDIPVSSDSKQDAMIFWIADQRLDIGKGYTNSEDLDPTLYSEHNLFDLKTRTGPLFKEIKQSGDKGRTAERYFYLTRNLEGKIVPKYIDEEVPTSKQVDTQPAPKGKIVRFMIAPILCAILSLFVLLVVLLRSRTKRELSEALRYEPTPGLDVKDFAQMPHNTEQVQATSIAPTKGTSIEHYTAEGVGIPLLENMNYQDQNYNMNEILHNEEKVCTQCGSPLRLVRIQDQITEKTLCVSCSPPNGKCPLCGSELRTKQAQQCPKCRASWRSFSVRKQPSKSTVTKKPCGAKPQHLHTQKKSRNLITIVGLTMICFALPLGCALLLANVVSSESRWYLFLLGICTLFAGGFISVLFFTIAQWGESRFGQANLFNLLLPGSLLEEWKKLIFHLLPSVVAGAGAFVAFFGIVLMIIGLVMLFKP